MNLKLIVFVTLFFSNYSFAQTNSEKKALVGTWKVYKLNYGDYYTYQIDEDNLFIREKLAKLILQDSARYDADFFKTIKSQAKKFAKNCSFQISDGYAYRLTMGSIYETKMLTFLPTQIPVSSETPESDITFNYDHKDDYALLKLKEKEISISEYSDAFSFVIFLNGFSSFIEGKAHPYVEFILKK